MSLIQIVPFEPQFADGVVRVILPIQRSEFELPVDLDAQPDLQDIAAFYQCNKGNFWVALAEGEVVGTLGLLDIGNRPAALRKMFVKVEYRGAPPTVAHRLLGVLVTWCRESRIREIYLGTTGKFLAAHRFYEKSGFKDIARAALPPAFPVMTVDTKFYCRVVDG